GLGPEVSVDRNPAAPAALVELPVDRYEVRPMDRGDDRGEDLEDRAPCRSAQDLSQGVALLLARAFVDEDLGRPVAVVQRLRPVNHGDPLAATEIGPIEVPLPDVHPDRPLAELVRARVAPGIA